MQASAQLWHCGWNNSAAIFITRFLDCTMVKNTDFLSKATRAAIFTHIACPPPYCTWTPLHDWALVLPFILGKLTIMDRTTDRCGTSKGPYKTEYCTGQLLSTCSNRLNDSPLTPSPIPTFNAYTKQNFMPAARVNRFYRSWLAVFCLQGWVQCIKQRNDSFWELDGSMWQPDIVIHLGWNSFSCS